MISIADDLYTWRRTYRLTQQAAADVAGVSRQTWQRWETGVYSPNEDHFNTLRWLVAQPPPGWVRDA